MARKCSNRCRTSPRCSTLCPATSSASRQDATTLSSRRPHVSDRKRIASPWGVHQNATAASDTTFYVHVWGPRRAERPGPGQGHLHPRLSGVREDRQARTLPGAWAVRVPRDRLPRQRLPGVSTTREQERERSRTGPTSAPRQHATSTHSQAPRSPLLAHPAPAVPARAGSSSQPQLPHHPSLGARLGSHARDGSSSCRGAHGQAQRSQTSIAARRRR